MGGEEEGKGGREGGRRRGRQDGGNDDKKLRPKEGWKVDAKTERSGYKIEGRK